MTKAELQKTVAEQAARIAVLAERIEGLEGWIEHLEAEGEGDAFRQEAGSHFEALVGALDAHIAFYSLPIRVRLEFEALAERLGAVLPLHRASNRAAGTGENAAHP